jgi:hypothetical protein
MTASNGAADPEQLAIQINVRPLQPQELAWPQSKAAGEHHHHLQAKICKLKQSPEPFRGEYLFRPHPPTESANLN